MSEVFWTERSVPGSPSWPFYKGRFLSRYRFSCCRSLDWGSMTVWESREAVGAATVLSPVRPEEQRVESSATRRDKRSVTRDR